MRVLERGHDGRPLYLEFTAQDLVGRTVHATGEAVAWLRFPGLTFIAYWWTMVKWRLDGQEFYGELQDGWPMQEHRRYVRAMLG
jgi:hypothetical protein